VIDTGLLISVVALVSAPVAWSRASNLRIDDERLTDAAIAPLLAGLLSARVATLILDDPEALRSLKDASVIRGGVDFWPGVFVAVAITAWSAHRAGKQPWQRVAALAPFALVAYSVFEATCIFREGCYGPRSSFGLQPTGIQSTMFPFGWLVAGVVLAAAVIVHRSSWTPRVRVWVAVMAVSWSRAISSFWLPKIGDGLTRAHQWSLTIAVATSVIGLVAWARSRRRITRADAADLGSGAQSVVDNGS